MPTDTCLLQQQKLE